MNLVVWSLVLSCLWAIAPIIHKMVFKFGLHPKSMMVFTGFAYLVVLSMWTIWNWKDIRSDVKHLTDWRVVTLIGSSAIFSVLVANLVYYHLIKEHDAHLVTAIACSSPLFTLFLAWGLLNETITPMSALGVVLIVIGVVLVSMRSSDRRS